MFLPQGKKAGSYPENLPFLMLIRTAVFTVLPLMKRFSRDMPQNIL